MCALLIVSGIVQLPAQTQTKKPTFDVVSVKPNLTDDPTVDLAPKRSGDRVRMHNCELTSIVAWAYRITNPNYQIVPGRWDKLLSDGYDIDAIVLATTTEDDLRLMFQSLLEDRFQFKAHLATTELPAYDLMVARGGPRLIATKPGPKISLAFGGSSSWVEITEHGLRLTGKGASMAELAVVLTRYLRMPVRDRTGLNGAYDYSLAFSSDPEPSDAPFLQTAIRDLGLDLRKTKGKFDQWVVDYVEKASPNQ